jgi:glycosyltransferase involved in cell wall biosynthesis
MTNRIALLHWGDVLEDFLDPIGLSLEGFRDEMSGGWMFGYIEALRTAGIETALICFSSRVEQPIRWEHRATGAELLAFPAPASYRFARRLLRAPYAWSARDAVHGDGIVNLVIGALAREAAPYLATPLRHLARALRRGRFGAILCQEYEYQRFDACVALGTLLRMPVFATFQGGALQRTTVERPLRRLAVRACNGLVIGSASEAQRVRGRYGVPDEKIARVLNPLDVTRWHPADRAEARAALGLPTDARIVAWHGRVEMHVKGLDVLLDAWRRVSHADALLLLVGTGASAEELRGRLSDPRFANVRWVDEYVLDRDLMRLYLSAADVYTLPSRREGFPVAPLEAMACGLPVVAADTAGVAEIFPDGEASGGTIVRAGDPDALFRALERLLADGRLRHELGLHARGRAETAFSLQAVGAALREFFVKRGYRPLP